MCSARIIGSAPQYLVSRLDADDEGQGSANIVCDDLRV